MIYIYIFVIVSQCSCGLSDIYKDVLKLGACTSNDVTDTQINTFSLFLVLVCNVVTLLLIRLLSRNRNFKFCCSISVLLCLFLSCQSVIAAFRGILQPHIHIEYLPISVGKKNQLDVTFCILYFSSNSCSTCFGQPCAHHQELTTAWCYSLVLVCTVAAGRWSSPVGR